MPKKHLKFYSSYPLIQVMADWNEGGYLGLYKICRIVKCKRYKKIK
ncbi:hypothetical protein PthBH41_32750 [Parageobacillus thermoglucosidasius]|nr:hypothetical protein PthBH41_32750 [Parageobacillus thermoglucosidasius]